MYTGRIYKQTLSTNLHPTRLKTILKPSQKTTVYSDWWHFAYLTFKQEKGDHPPKQNFDTPWWNFAHLHSK